MAKQQGKVYLGYEEEPVSEKNQTLLNYNVNKIGGFPVRKLLLLKHKIICCSSVTLPLLL